MISFLSTLIEKVLGAVLPPFLDAIENAIKRKSGQNKASTKIKKILERGKKIKDAKTKADKLDAWDSDT